MEKTVLSQQSANDKALMLPQEKKMALCDICGSFLVANDAVERTQTHVTGKQHIGYGMVRDFLSEYKVGFSLLVDFNSNLTLSYFGCEMIFCIFYIRRLLRKRRGRKRDLPRRKKQRNEGDKGKRSMRIGVGGVSLLEETDHGNVNVTDIQIEALRGKDQGIGVEEEAEMGEEDQIGGLIITEMGGNQIGTGFETGLPHEAGPDLLPGIAIESQEAPFDNTSI